MFSLRSLVNFKTVFTYALTPKYNLISKAFFSLNQVGKVNAEQPFDYTKRNYNLFWKLFYSTLCNIDDNTLCVSIESNHGVNRTKMAKELAALIDFLYIPPPDVDRMYRYDDNGIDQIQVWNDCVLPDRKFPTFDEWLLDPCLGMTIQYQFVLLKIRMYQYRMSHIHMLSTGQGVLLDRCYWSDSVIAGALHDTGHLSDEAIDCLNEYHELYDYELKRPHLIIYIDKPVHECLKTIRAEGTEAQKNSPLFADEKYLTAVEHQYKNVFLPKMSKCTPVLMFDWDDVDVQMIAEDMERVDFTDESKFDDWKVLHDTEMDYYRCRLSDDKFWINSACRLYKHKLVPELTALGDEALQVNAKLMDHPDLKWEKGFDPKKDKFITLKLFGQIRNPFKLNRKPFI